jgi:hypothetical protein
VEDEIFESARYLGRLALREVVQDLPRQINKLRRRLQGKLEELMEVERDLNTIGWVYSSLIIDVKIIQ